MVKVVEDKRNEFFGRQELKIIVDAEQNPSFEESTKIVASHTKKDESLIAIKGVKGKFGRRTFLIKTYVYDSQEDKDKVEPKKEAKEESTEEKKEEVPAEKPVEGVEVKEEIKTEALKVEAKKE